MYLSTHWGPSSERTLSRGKAAPGGEGEREVLPGGNNPLRGQNGRRMGGDGIAREEIPLPQVKSKFKAEERFPSPGNWVCGEKGEECGQWTEKGEKKSLF